MPNSARPRILVVNDDSASLLALSTLLSQRSDGYEVARRLRTNADTRHIKLIALTGYGLANDQRRVLDAGFDMHLVKQVEIDKLLDAIRLCAGR